MLTENELKNQIAIGKSYAEQQDKDDWTSGGGADFDYHNGYIYALEWVLGLVRARYDKEDV